MKYPKNRYTGEHPWMDRDWLYNEYIIKDKASIEIANEWHCAQATIQHWLLEFGIKKPITHHIHKWDKQYQQFEYLYQTHIVEHKSMAEIARLNNISQDTVRYNLLRLGIEPWTTTVRRVLTASDIKKIIDLYQMGLSCKRIGELYGVRHKRISSILKKNHIPVRSISEMNLIINKSSISNIDEFNDYDFMYNLYWVLGWTLYEIAEYFGGVHYGVIRRQLVHLGINLRSSKRNMFKNTGLEILKRALRGYIANEQTPRVFKRDKYTCQRCFKSFPDVYLNAHHYKPFSGIVRNIMSKHNELDPNVVEDRIKLFDIITSDDLFNDDNNVVTLCVECHKDIHHKIL